jgi:phosphoribosylformylglycinamidine synthase
VPRVLILRAPGTNCDLETAYAFERAGGKPERVHINRLLENPKLAAEFQILCIPGGFSYGDDIAAGRILANQIRHHLTDVLTEFKDAGKLILGICNGFQVLIRAGSVLLPESAGGEPAATLSWNKSGRFVDRWVNLRTSGDKCVFLRGIESMYLPIAHAEGQFITRDDETLAALEAGEQLALRYAPDGRTSNVQRPTSNIEPDLSAVWLHHALLSGFALHFLASSFRSMFDVGRSMFDVQKNT